MLSKTPKTLLAAFLVTAVATAVTGCADETDSIQNGDQNLGRVIQPIIHGVAAGTESDSVVVLTTFQNGTRQALCTATLIAPNLVITARHCVSNTVGTTACAQDGSAVTGGTIQGNRTAASLVIFAGKNGVAPDTTVEANGAAHGKKVVIDASTNVCNHDIAFVVLDKDVAAPVSPIRMGAPAPSEAVNAVGWGVDETGNLPPQREVRWNIPLVGVGPAPYPNNPSWGYGDREFMIGESACAGDSGSPAFAASGAIVGIAARTGNGKPSDGNYATTCLGTDAHVVYTHLGQFQNLVDAAFGASGHTAWLEGQADPYAAIPTTSSSGASGSSGTATGSGAGGAGASSSGSAAGIPPVKKDSAKADLLGGGDEPSSPIGAKDSGGGCSMSSSDPQHDNVAYAAGVVALLALVLGLRRRFRGDSKRDDEHEAPPAREPYESMFNPDR